MTSNYTPRYIPKRTKKKSDSDTHMPMFTVALFTIAKKWKKRKGLSTNKWINKMWYIHTGEHYSVIEKEF